MLASQNLVATIVSSRTKAIQAIAVVWVLLLGCGRAAATENMLMYGCVGERIDLPGGSWRAIDSRTGQAIPDLRDIAMADYAVEVSDDGAVRTVLSPLLFDDSDFSSSRTMSFFFHRTGDYRLLITGGDGYTIEAALRVTSPRASVTRLESTTVSRFSRDDYPILGLGTPGSPGLRFDYTLQMGDCAGETGDLQTLVFTDIESVNRGGMLRYSSNGEMTLDYEPGYDTSWHYGFRKSAGFNEQLQLSYEDSPKMYLANSQLCVASEAEFYYYVLFRSAAPGAAWVPVAELNWQLQMFAKRADGETPWLDEQSVEFGGKATVGEGFHDTVEHWPSWTRGWTMVEPEPTSGACP